MLKPPYEANDAIFVEVNYFEEDGDEEVAEAKWFDLARMASVERLVKDLKWALEQGYVVEIGNLESGGTAVRMRGIEMEETGSC